MARGTEGDVAVAIVGDIYRGYPRRKQGFGMTERGILVVRVS